MWIIPVASSDYLKLVFFHHVCFSKKKLSSGIKSLCLIYLCLPGAQQSSWHILISWRIVQKIYKSYLGVGMAFEWISSVLQNKLRTVLSMWGFGWLSSLGIGYGEEESKESSIYFTYWLFFSESSDNDKTPICWNEFLAILRVANNY